MEVVKLVRPKNISTSTYSQVFKKKELDDYINSVDLEKGNIQGKSLYISSKIISQSKLREQGFSITRSPDRADVVVIKDIRKSLGKEYQSDNYQYCDYSNNFEVLTKYFDELEELASKDYKFIFDNQLYKYLYKYKGNQELFNNICELLQGNTKDNTKIAMEFMCNADWEGNQLYLQEIFNKYYHGNIRSNRYKQGISFKGFLNSLDFSYENTRLYNASDYRNLCLNDEHHQWVYDKFNAEFKRDLDSLVKEHKIKLTKIEYEIDKDLLYED